MASRCCAHAAESAPSVPALALASSALARAARAAGSPVVRYSSAFCASEGSAPSSAAARFFDSASALAAVPGGSESAFSRNGATDASYSSSLNTVSHARVYMVCGRKWQSSAPYEDASSISSSESLFSRVSRARMWYWHSAGLTTPRFRHASRALFSIFSRCSSTKSEKDSHVGGASFESTEDLYRYWLASRSKGLRDMQNDSAITPYSSFPSFVWNAGGSGGRCHTLQLNPGMVLYPNSNSKFAGSVAAHMPSLFNESERETTQRKRWHTG